MQTNIQVWIQFIWLESGDLVKTLLAIFIRTRNVVIINVILSRIGKGKLPNRGNGEDQFFVPGGNRVWRNYETHPTDDYKEPTGNVVVENESADFPSQVDLKPAPRMLPETAIRNRCTSHFRSLEPQFLTERIRRQFPQFLAEPPRSSSQWATA